MSPRNKQENALGKGLDALIRRDYLDQEDETSQEAEEKIEKPEDEPTKTTENIEEPQKSDEKEVTTGIPETQDLYVDDRIVEDVLLEVHKNPRISLWSAKSAAVLRFLKKTKPEFSISNEASHLIEAAVKDRHPDIWKIFEDKGL